MGPDRTVLDRTGVESGERLVGTRESVLAKLFCLTGGRIISY